MRTHIKVLTALILIVLIFGIATLLSKQSSDVIQIGYIGPLTGDGAAWGLIEKNAIDLAVNEINEAGGINEKKIEILYEDGKCNGVDAISAAHKLLPITQILLVSCSQEILPLAPITEKIPALIFASYAASSKISSAGEYIFRNSWTNRDLGKFAAQHIITQYKRIAIITEVTDFAADFRDIFKKEFEHLGGTVIADKKFPAGEKDTRTQLTKILQLKPQAVFINPTGPTTGIPILKQLEELNFTGQLYGNFFGGSREVQTHQSADAMIYFADPDIEDSTQKQLFLEKYQTSYGEYPDLEWPAVARYDAVYILTQAITSVGTDPDDLKKYLYTMEPFEGLLGTYHFDKHGDMTGIIPAMKVIKKNQSFLLMHENKEGL